MLSLPQANLTWFSKLVARAHSQSGGRRSVEVGVYQARLLCSAACFTTTPLFNSFLITTTFLYFFFLIVPFWLFVFFMKLIPFPRVFFHRHAIVNCSKRCTNKCSTKCSTCSTKCCSETIQTDFGRAQQWCAAPAQRKVWPTHTMRLRLCVGVWWGGAQPTCLRLWVGVWQGGAQPMCLRLWVGVWRGGAQPICLRLCVGVPGVVLNQCACVCVLVCSQVRDGAQPSSTG